jgi:hypothetical protein
MVLSLLLQEGYDLFELRDGLLELRQHTSVCGVARIAGKPVQREIKERLRHGVGVMGGGMLGLRVKHGHARHNDPPFISG